MSRREKSSGLTPQETTVMDLWDKGHGIGAISTASGIPNGTVRRIVRMYDAGQALDVAYAQRCRVASIAYLAAIAACGGRFV
ncbi:hypothetical protein [Sphingomonas sp. TX0522]|uniref:hypothetical protein n=1 Tax=Sphingomonas sp. TX0522 TaxID=2479205 RepID=UPI0018E01840|nr:hypothetical protein [Sphingomonas sp. TX0522]MBI0530064.1 hypothetical protein [Sphingomonas sp. TX0522]